MFWGLVEDPAALVLEILLGGREAFERELDVQSEEVSSVNRVFVRHDVRVHYAALIRLMPTRCCLRVGPPSTALFSGVVALIRPQRHPGCLCPREQRPAMKARLSLLMP